MADYIDLTVDNSPSIFITILMPVKKDVVYSWPDSVKYRVNETEGDLSLKDIGVDVSVLSIEKLYTMQKFGSLFILKRIWRDILLRAPKLKVFEKFRAIVQQGLEYKPAFLIGTDVVEYYNDGVFNHVVLHITGEHRGEIQYSNKIEEAPAIIENIIGDEVIDHNFYSSSSDLKRTYILEFENTNEVLSASESITDKKDMFSIALKAFLDRCNFKFLKSKTDTTTIKNSNSEKLVIKDDYTVHQYKELHAYACGEVGTIPSVFCDIALMLEGGESLKLVPYPNFEKIEEIYPDNFYFNKLKGYFLKDTSYTAGENTLKTLKEITAMTNGGGLFNKIMASVASGFSFYFPNDTDSYAIDKKQPDGSVTTVRINDKNTYLERLMLQAVDVDDNEKVLAGLESVAFSMVTELTGYLNSTDNIVLRYLEGDDTLLKDRYYEVKKIRKASRKLISVLKERQNTENVGEMGDYQQPKFIDTLLSILAGVKGFVMSYLSATDTTNELMDALEQYRTTSTVLRLVVDNSDGIEEIFKEMPPVKL